MIAVIMNKFARRESCARAEPQSAMAPSATLNRAMTRYEPTMAVKRKWASNPVTSNMGNAVAYNSQGLSGAPKSFPSARVSGDRRVVRQKSKVRCVRSLTTDCVTLSRVQSTRIMDDATKMAPKMSFQ